MTLEEYLIHKGWTYEPDIGLYLREYAVSPTKFVVRVCSPSQMEKEYKKYLRKIKNKLIGTEPKE